MSIFSSSYPVNDGGVLTERRARANELRNRYKFFFIQLRSIALLREFHFASAIQINTRLKLARKTDAAERVADGSDALESRMMEVTRPQTLAIGAGGFLTELLAGGAVRAAGKDTLTIA